MGYKKGDRVCFIANLESEGTVVSDVYHKPGPLQDVLWDVSGLVTEWDPFFLRPAGCKPSGVMDKVIAGNLMFLKDRNEILDMNNADAVKNTLDDLDLWMIFAEGGPIH